MMTISKPVVAAAGLILALLLTALVKWISPRRLIRLPPGPKGKFIIGNLLDLPPKGAEEWQHWLKHKELYGNPTPFMDMERKLKYR